MATQIENATPAGVSSKVTVYVNQQLEVARRQVKSTDLIGGVLIVLAFALTLLLIFAICDAWIWPLSETGRWICFSILMAGCMGYAALQIAPLVMKKINPEYAARMIEQAKPGFKNSLLNYLSLRKRADDVNQAVYQAVSRQAAENLRALPADATVDRSKLIFWGFVLVGLSVFTLGYKLLSPKDPLQSFARVLIPSARIAQPSKVSVSEIRPGDTKVFFGDQVEVTAVVRGNYHPSDVFVILSTGDGQLSNQRVPMEPDTLPNRFRVVLGKEGAGLQHSISYRVAAVDGISPAYEITVQPNPTIAIESLTFHPPKYTKLPLQTQVGQGEITVLEGTKIVAEAIANLPIREAYLDLLQVAPEAFNNNDQKPRYRTVDSIPMTVDGPKAKATFWALLNRSREQSLASHYQIRFVSVDGNRNLRPNLYPIKVIPDLAPEIRVLNPRDTEIPVSADGSLAVDFEANDLDFEIAEVQFLLNHRGHLLVQERLATQPVNGNQRVRGRYVLQPRELQLKVGDTAMFFLTAADNRTVPAEEGRPDPNITRSSNFTVTITDPTGQNQEANPNPPPNSDPNRQEPEKPKDQKQNQNPENNQNGTDTDNQNQPPSATEPNKPGDQADPPENNSNTVGQEKGSANTRSEQGNAGDQSDSQNPNSDPNQPQGNSGNSESQSEMNSESNDAQSGDSGAASQPSSQPNDANELQSGDQSSTGSQPSTGSQNNSSTGQGSSSDARDDNSDQNNQPGPASSSSQKSNQSSQSSSNRANQPGGNFNGDENADGAESSGGETRDGNLQDGQRKPLGKDATQGEQMRRLDEILNDQEKNNDNQSGNSGENDSSEPPSDQQGSEQGTEDNSRGSRDTGNSNQNSQGAKDQDNEADARDSQTGSQPDEGRPEKANDGGQANDQNSNDRDSGDPDSKSRQSDQQPAGDQSANNQQKGNPQSGNQTSGNQQPGNQQPGENDPSGDPSADNQQSEQGTESTRDSAAAQQESDPKSDSKQSPMNADSKSGNQGSKQSPQRDPNNIDANQEGSSDPSNFEDQSNKGNQSNDQQPGDTSQGKSDSGDKNQPKPSQSDANSAQNPSRQPADQPSGQDQNSSDEAGDENSTEQQNDAGKSGQQSSNSKQSQKPSSGQESPSQNDSQKNADSKGEQSSQQQNGDNSEGEPTDGDSQSASDGSENQSKPGDKPGKDRMKDATNNGPGRSTSPSSAESAPGGPGSGDSFDLERDKLNLDHAKRATDMILKKLNDQKYDPDPKLLEAMNWTKEDLEKFLSRWQEMKAAAENGDPRGQRRYEQMLRSLDFRANSAKRVVRQSKENIEGLHQDSAVIQPPPEFAPDFNATLRDLNRND